MHSDEFNQAAWYSDGQQVYMGTLNGIIWWNKKMGRPDKTPRAYAIHINKFTVAGNNNDIKTMYHLAYLPQDSIHLQIPAGTRYFSLTFDSPGDQNDNQPLYYRLGSKESWVNLGTRREITFNKMQPGRYQLQLTRSIKGGQAARATFQIPITILPAYYQTIWFKICVLLIIAGIILLIIYLRQKQLDKERLLRTKIAGDLHDEIGSSLTRIWHQAQRLRTDDIKGPASERKIMQEKKLQHIAETSQGAIAMLSDMVWSIDAQFDNLEELVVRMKTYVFQLQNDYDIAIQMVTTNAAKDRKVSQMVRQNLFLLFKEAINNAIKYGNGSLINITLDIEAKIKLQVSNAFDPKAKTNTAIGGRGIENMQRRAKNMNGELKIENKDNIFTLIILV